MKNLSTLILAIIMFAYGTGLILSNEHDLLNGLLLCGIADILYQVTFKE